MFQYPNNSVNAYSYISVKLYKQLFSAEWPEEEDEGSDRPISTERHADQSQKQSQVAATLKWYINSNLIYYL